MILILIMAPAAPQPVFTVVAETGYLKNCPVYITAD
jgi:hypothetical protein